MSMFTKVGDFAHGALLNSAGMGAMGNISQGAGIGAGVGAVNALVTGNDSILGGAISGGVMGGIGGAGMRYGGMKYAAGMESFINSTKSASGSVYAGTKQNLGTDITKFKFSNFTTPNNTGAHANFMTPDIAALTRTKFQNYDPSLTPSASGSKTASQGSSYIDQYTKEYY